MSEETTIEERMARIKQELSHLEFLDEKSGGHVLGEGGSQTPYYNEIIRELEALEQRKANEEAFTIVQAEQEKKWLEFGKQLAEQAPDHCKIETGGRVYEIAENYIRYLRTAEIMQKVKEAPEPKFRVGDKVRLASGEMYIVSNVFLTRNEWAFELDNIRGWWLAHELEAAK